MKNKKTIIIMLVLIGVFIIGDLLLYVTTKNKMQPIEEENPIKEEIPIEKEESKNSQYKCTKENVSEGDGGKILESYDFEYKEEEQKIVNGFRKITVQFLEQTSYNASKEAPITSVWSKDIPNDMEYNDQNLSVTYIWNIIYHDSANISDTDYIKKLNEMHYACEKVA